MIGNLNPQILVDPVAASQPRLRACLDDLLDTADPHHSYHSYHPYHPYHRHHRSGEVGLACLPVGARCGCLVAARVYRAIGTRRRQLGNACWLGRTVMPRRTQHWVAWRALLSTPLSPSFWLPARQHDATLHGALAVLLGADAPPKSRDVKRT